MYKENIIKGWINFQGTGTISINDSFNVTSITRTSTGDYTITWDVNFAEINYAVAVTAGGSGQSAHPKIHDTTPLTTGTTRIMVLNNNHDFIDAEIITVIVVGNQ